MYMKLINKIYNKALIKYYNVSVGKNFVCEGRLIIQGHGKYSIGNNVHIISEESINPIGGNRTVLQTLDGASITIGNNCGLSHAVLAARKEIVIEDDVMIGAGVRIFDNDFHSIDYASRMENPDTNIRSSPVRIRQGAFIGAHSILLKGVEIGHHAVIGAGSVVTKSVPGREIWAGNPATFVREIKEGE